MGLPELPILIGAFVLWAYKGGKTKLSEEIDGGDDDKKWLIGLITIIVVILVIMGYIFLLDYV